MFGAVQAVIVNPCVSILNAREDALPVLGVVVRHVMAKLTHNSNVIYNMCLSNTRIAQSRRIVNTCQFNQLFVRNVDRS